MPRTGLETSLLSLPNTPKDARNKQDIDDEVIPKWKVTLALITVQVIFGGGAVVGKLGLPSFNPMLFAFIREACAGPILLVIAMQSRQAFPSLTSDSVAIGLIIIIALLALMHRHVPVVCI